MLVELEVNCLENEWWFDFGISYQKTPYHHSKRHVFTIALCFVSLYIRW